MGDPAAPRDCAVVFVVKDLETSLDYYQNALGFEVTFRFGEPAFYAAVCRGAVAVHLQAAEKTERPAGASLLNVFVDDVDAIHAELRERGARVMKEPATYPYGMRDFDVQDPDGNTLVFGCAAEDGA